MGIFSSPARDEEGKELKRRRTDQIPFSIIASDMTVTGDLETEGVVRVEGRVRGTVRVAPEADIEAAPEIEDSVSPGQQYARPTSPGSSRSRRSPFGYQRQVKTRGSGFRASQDWELSSGWSNCTA